MACCQPHKLDSQTKKTISTRAREHGYHSAQDFFIGTLAHGIARIAASFYPRPVIVRFSDFKSNEYRQLVGGSFFEPHEENPLLGLRGASRYTNELYAPAFKLECAALKKARSMGFTNIKLMIPFVRTVQEAHAVTSLLTKNGLKRSSHLEYIMMCELPSNVVSFASFCPLFDGFSIGSNDLTQLTLGVDRDSALLAPLFDERTPEVKEMIGLAITYACKNKKTIGICGQAPSDYPELISWLFKQGISYISLTEDSL
jgi:pyruvate,water dikinase